MDIFGSIFFLFAMAALGLLLAFFVKGIWWLFQLKKQTNKTLLPGKGRLGAYLLLFLLSLGLCLSYWAYQRPDTQVALPTPQVAFGSQDPKTLPFVASEESSLFHQANCSYVDALSPESLRYFSERADALAQEKSPCPHCLPE